jgi:hypothetical protein
MTAVRKGELAALILRPEGWPFNPEKRDYPTGKGHPVVFPSPCPPLLRLQNIDLTFGVAALLSGAELAIAAGDRV